jgi:hypothetical protein
MANLPSIMDIGMPDISTEQSELENVTNTTPLRDGNIEVEYANSDGSMMIDSPIRSIRRGPPPRSHARKWKSSMELSYLID